MNLPEPSLYLRQWKADRHLNYQIEKVDEYLKELDEHKGQHRAPVLFFNASTRIHRLSLNGAYSLLTSWALRDAGIPVRHIVCQRGMQQCVLGTRQDRLDSPPPCTRCIRLSQRLFPQDLTIPLHFQQETVEKIGSRLQNLTFPELAAWEFQNIPLGELCLPGLRWALRSHQIPDTQAIRQLIRQYILSAYSLYTNFEGIVDSQKPRALVVFNGIFYPEAIARYVGQTRGIPVITHEVGLRPFSTFFSNKDATFRQVDLDKDASLTSSENERLDQYLSERFHGDFTMAGIRFWPNMVDLPNWLLERMKEFGQTVLVFTNVVFDTSQIHANTLFSNMFEWLEMLKPIILSHPETLFIIRAHPDEERPGKRSQESVKDWIVNQGLLEFENVVFFEPGDPVSSYELINHSKFILVYNSSIGLEASILKVPVLCAGRARFTQIPTVFFPESRKKYEKELVGFLAAPAIEIPLSFRENARSFLYQEYFSASLDLSEFLQPDDSLQGMVTFSGFSPDRLRSSRPLEVIRDGILHGMPFLFGSDVEAEDV
ncbi:MAG: hypothetical protein MUP44_02655 [Anaerolineales bacterium]|nr:hypothetical protein [Anaerolineales bacterium]